MNEWDDILGADPVYGPPSPADLAQLDRKLTPAEQRAVDEYQSKQAEGYEAAALASGAPKASVSVTKKGAVLQGSRLPAGPEVPAWKMVLAGLGVVIASAGVYTMVRRR